VSVTPAYLPAFRLVVLLYAERLTRAPVRLLADVAPH
jgi:hypothetical protein